MEHQPSVLIVDPSDENRDILRTALSRKGLFVHTAGVADEALALARTQQPRLIVLDMEMAEVASEAFDAPADAAPRRGPPSIVVLGRCRRLRQRLPSGEFVPKPYHYGPLVRRIEELLKTSQSSTR